MPGTKTGPICWRNSRGDPEDWRVSVRRGGYPTPAVHLGTTEERTIWFDGYASTYLERDLRSLSSITALPDFRRLMRATALRIGQPVNQTELGRDVSLPQPTVRRYLNLLEISYLLVRLPAYSVSRTKRLIKSPKIYWGDAGLALHLAGQNEPGGAHLENLVLHDLLAWRDSRLNRAEILYWRTTVGEEVDFVVETDGSLLPIEVKATSRPRLGDARHLRTFRRNTATWFERETVASFRRVVGMARAWRACGPVVETLALIALRMEFRQPFRVFRPECGERFLGSAGGSKIRPLAAAENMLRLPTRQLGGIKVQARSFRRPEFADLRPDVRYRRRPASRVDRLPARKPTPPDGPRALPKPGGRRSASGAGTPGRRL